MKRLLIAVILLAAGSGVFCSMQVGANRLNENISATRESIHARSAELEAAREERKTLKTRVSELRQSVRSKEAISAATSATAELAAFFTKSGGALTPDITEKLLAEFGFNWNTTGDFLIVSKPTLAGISMNGMNGTKLRDAACGVLAVTPSERSALEATTQKIAEDYRVWAENHSERTEPHDDVVAQYKVTIGPEYSQSASNALTSQALATLGRERGELFLQYAGEWSHSYGLDGAEPATLTVNRQNNRDGKYYLYTIKSAYNTMTTSVNPWQPFPESFRALFPNGWADLAAREGFELPDDFKKHKAR